MRARSSHACETISPGTDTWSAVTSGERGELRPRFARSDATSDLVRLREEWKLLRRRPRLHQYGSTVVRRREVTHLAFGDLVGRVRDPFGNVWWVQTRIEDVSPEEMERRFADPRFTAAMENMQRPETAIFAG